MYEQPDNGGLGLACLQARILSFRFSAAQRFLNLVSHPANYFMAYFLRQYCKLGFDYQMFYIKTYSKFYTSLPVFYSEVLRAWTVSGARIKTQPISINLIVNMPLISTHILAAADDGGFLPARLMACGVKLVRHLFDPSSGQWLDPCIFQRHFRGLRPPSLRLIEHELRLLRSALSQCFPTLFLEKGCHLPDSVALQTVPLFPSSPVNFVLPSFENGLIATSKIAYRIFNNELNNLSSTLFSHWHDIGYLEPSTKLNWNLIYQLPTSKKEGDTQFRLLHNILPPLVVLHHFNPVISSLCGWCGEKGTIQHLFIQCPAIQPALKLLYDLLDHLLPSVQPTFDMYWTLVPHARGRSREAVRLANFLIISCKHVIYNSFRTALFPDPLIVWVHRLKSRILFEFHYYKLCHNPYTFFRNWSVNDTLFVLKEEALSWLI